TFTYTVQAGDPVDLDNSVTVTADGVTSEAAVTDTAECDTTNRNPEVTITKTCPDFGLVGDVLTYQIVVTNSGDEALENVVVTDTVEGQLAQPVPGAPTTLAVDASAN